MSNPYEILGISPSATDEEVKKAYHEMGKKYHPDGYMDNPLAGLAEEKFKEVQEAYCQIMDERLVRSNPNSGSYSGQDDYNIVHQNINMGRYADAMDLLERIPGRTAIWYYFAALANEGLGNNVAAQQYAQTAASMEPGNPDYINLWNRFRWGGQAYKQTGRDYGRRGASNSDLCCSLCIADSCCECMGGDLCTCC